MATPESKVKKACTAVLQRHGVYYFFPTMIGMGRVGIPDIICCLRGYFVAIECKAGSHKPTALQTRELQRIRDAGGISMVINEDNLDTLEPFIKERMHGTE